MTEFYIALKLESTQKKRSGCTPIPSLLYKINFHLFFFSFAAKHPDTFSWPLQLNIHVNYSVAAADKKKKKKRKKKQRLSARETGTKTKTNAAAHTNIMSMCDRLGTLRDGRYGSLAELCDQWNINSCCRSSVKQPAGWLHSNVFLSPRLQNVTNDHWYLISAVKHSVLVPNDS